MRRRRPSAVLTAVVAALVLVTGAAAAPKKTKFVSKRHDYSIVLPGGSARWLMNPASVDWSGSSPDLSTPEYDHLGDLQTGLTYIITAKRVSADMTLQKWTNFLVSITNPGCTLPPLRYVNTQLAGARAREYVLQCPEGTALDVGAVRARRGFFFICLTHGPLSFADWRACNAVRRSLRPLPGKRASASSG